MTNQSRTLAVGQHANTGLASFWMQRIKAANPIVAAVALKIATDSALDPAYNVEAVIISKLAEWNVSADHQAARAYGMR